MRLVLLLLLVAALAGCGDEGGSRAGPVPRSSPTPTSKKVDRCPNRPERPVPAPKGLLELEGAVVDRVTTGESLIAQGFIPHSPDAFLALVNAGGYAVGFQETEGWEAEALITAGRYRNFWRVISVCPEGSEFTVVIVDAGAAR